MIVIHNDPEEHTIPLVVAAVNKDMEDLKGMKADNPKYKNRLTSVLCELYERRILSKPPKWTGDHTIEIYAMGTVNMELET